MLKTKAQFAGLDKKKYPWSPITAHLKFIFNILGVRLSHAIQILGVWWGVML